MRVVLNAIGFEMFRTKVCGIKTSEDFNAAVDAGIDAVGLNFATESPRY
ncbi:MAG: N-(5phosphoribosyl)anthranilate isomerase, partial [Planctomycetota bacterium]